MNDVPPARGGPWAQLRDASSASRLAVSMLVGPLAPWQDSPPSPERLRAVLLALDESTRQVAALVAQLGAAQADVANASARPLANVDLDAWRASETTNATPPANAAPTSSSVAVAPPASVTTSTTGATSAAKPASPMRARAPEPTTRRASRRDREPAAPSGPQAGTTDAAAVLRHLEIDASAIEDLRVDARATGELRCAADHESIRAVLGRLVRDAAAMGPHGGIVEVRAYAELADALGDEMEVVFEVRPDARARPGQTFEVGPADLPAATRLEVHGRGGRPRARLRAAMLASARILAA